MKYFTLFFMFIYSALPASEYEEAVELLKNREYEEAAHHFKLASRYPEKNEAAGFGRVLCDMALGKYEKIEKHMGQITSRCESCESLKKMDHAPETPAEQLTAYRCRQHVRKVAQNLRNLVEKMVAETVPGFLQKIRTFRQLNPYIDTLERNGLACCQKGQTSESCAEPLVRQLDLWNSEGLPIKPKNK